MISAEDLKSLIMRMSEPDQRASSSSQSDSWLAHREAEKLSDLNLIPTIQKLNFELKKPKQFQALYFVLGAIAKNAGSKEALSLLLCQISKESHKDVLSTLLDAVADLSKPLDLNIDAIVQATKDKRWTVRHSAIRALKHSSNADAEMALIKILEAPLDDQDIIYANATLANIGTKKCIPHLNKFANSKKNDVRETALTAIETIQKNKI